MTPFGVLNPPYGAAVTPSPLTIQIAGCYLTPHFFLCISEWNRLEQRVRETLQDAKISKILRIQNKWLWDRFAVHKKRMQYKNSSYTNEKDLFHGARGRDPKLIYEGEEGFGMRFSAQGKWGLANYFALNASYADRYAHQTCIIYSTL